MIKWIEPNSLLMKVAIIELYKIISYRLGAEAIVKGIHLIGFSSRKLGDQVTQFIGSYKGCL